MTPLSLATTRLASITHFVLVSREVSVVSLTSIDNRYNRSRGRNKHGRSCESAPSMLHTFSVFLYRDTFLDEKHVDQCVMCHTHGQTGKKVGGWSADGNEPTTTRTVIGAGESESAAGRDRFSGA